MDESQRPGWNTGGTVGVELLTFTLESCISLSLTSFDVQMVVCFIIATAFNRFAMEQSTALHHANKINISAPMAECDSREEEGAAGADERCDGEYGRIR